MRKKATWILCGLLVCISFGVYAASDSVVNKGDYVRRMDSDEVYIEIISTSRILKWNDDSIPESSIEVVAKMLIKEDDPLFKLILPEGPSDENGYAFYPRVVSVEEIDVSEHFSESAEGFAMRITVTAKDNNPDAKLACLAYTPLKRRLCAPLPATS